MALTIPFGKFLRLGSTGTQPVGVKRALWRAGFRAGWGGLDGVGVAARVLGPFAVRKLKAFQKKNGLKADGVYGPATHRLLTPHFDRYARLLYTKPTQSPSPVAILLPKEFTPTHQTAGLPGYPAIDVFAKPGTMVLAPEAGTVTKLSGHNPADGGTPGSAYGWSIYLTVPHAVYYITHLHWRAVYLGQKVKGGELVGTVCDAAVAHMASSASHVHLGKHEL